jgi:hypothetical protein
MMYPRGSALPPLPTSYVRVSGFKKKPGFMVTVIVKNELLAKARAAEVDPAVGYAW